MKQSDSKNEHQTTAVYDEKANKKQISQSFINFSGQIN